MFSLTVLIIRLACFSPFFGALEQFLDSSPSVSEVASFYPYMQLSGNRRSPIGGSPSIERKTRSKTGVSRSPEVSLAPGARRDSGDHSAVEPPGPIPNPEVKHCSADGSAAIGRVRVGRCQFISPPSSEGGDFFALFLRSRDASVGFGAPRPGTVGLWRVEISVTLRGSFEKTDPFTP